MHVTIDFETRSAVDLKRCGASVYARHPSTEVLCMAWAWNGESYLWHPSLEPPRRLFELIARGEPVEAHNAFFEQCIWQHVCVERLGWPAIAPEQWRCSMAACSRLALPRSLEDAGKALGLSIRKDKEGAKVMLRLCRIDPAQPASLFDQSHELPRLYAYCRRDVDSEIAISQAIEPLPERELAIWRLDQRINHRGIPIDRDAVTHALAIVDAEYEASSRQLQQLTGGAVDTPKSVKAMMSWIEARCGRCPPDLSAASVESWLGTEAMDDRVRAVLEIRRDCALSSPAKLQAMLDRCDGDGRVRGNLMYHGAAPGRWSGMGIQIQNFPRGTLKPYLVDAVHELLSLRSPRAIDLLVGSPIRSMASSLRSMIRAETGKRLLVCDFSQIEARVLAWLAGQEDLVALFAADGLVYEEMASRIYDVPVEQVTQEQRFIGKTSVLGCGYGMGAKAFQQACRLVGKVEISLRFARTVIAAYRQANDRIKQLWADLNQACIDAVGTKETVTLGRLVIRCDGVWMRIRLPAGRELHYREPRIESVEAPWSRGWTGWIGGPESMAEELEERGIVLGEREGGGWVDCDIPPTAETADLKVKSLKRKTPEFIEQISYMSVNSQTKKWQRERTYGGKLVENVVQATARDFLADAMLRVEAAGYPIIATVHDEIISEASDGVGSLAEFETLMREVPPWGSGCPIDVEGYEARRYRK